MANPKNPTPAEIKALSKKMINNFRQGIYSNESRGSGGYSAVSPDGGALGRYQFRTTWHWDAIKKHAKELGMGDITQQDFLNSEKLQESYFENVWFEKEVLPESIKLYNEYGSKYDLSLEEIAAIYHFRGGGGAKKALKNNTLNERTESNNKTIKEFVKTYRETIPRNIQVEQKKPLDPKIAKETAKNYYKRRKEIINSDKSDYLKSLELEDLNKEIWKSGYRDPINVGIKEHNNVIVEKAKQKKDNVLKAVQLLNDMNDRTGDYQVDKSRVFGDPEKSHDFGGTTRIHEQKNIEKYLPLLDDPNFKGVIKKGVAYDISDPTEIFGEVKVRVPYIEINNAKFFEALQNSANSMLPPDKKINFVEIKDGKIYKGKDYVTSANAVIPNPFNRGKTAKEFLVIPTEWQNNLNEEQIINTEIVPEIEIKNDWLTDYEEEEQKQEQEQQTTSPEENQTGSNSYEPTEAQKEIKEEEQEENVTGHDNADLFFGSNSYIDDESRIANTDDYKGIDIPAAEIGASLFGIISGMNAAGTELPERDEMISDALLQYTNELKRISQQGLSPEEEAYAKNNLKESYSIGLDTIVRASGGNRNVVLGNASRLDAQMQKGLMDISLADFEKREKALFAYGEAVKYIDNVELNKQIANNERLYQNAVATKEAGAEIMANGIQSLLDNVQYYKENSPGSANHALKSLYNRQAFGYDPNIKDNGKGDIKYSYSWYQKQEENFSQLMKTRQEYNDKYSSLSVDQKKEVDSYLRNTNYNMKLAHQFVDGLISNNQFNQAMNGQQQPYIPDMSDVHSGSNASTPENMNQEGIITLTDEQLNSPETYKTMPTLNAYTNNSSYNPGFNNLYGKRNIPNVEIDQNPFNYNSTHNYYQAIQDQEIGNLVRDFNINNLNFGGYSQSDIDRIIKESQSLKDYDYLKNQGNKYGVNIN